MGIDGGALAVIASIVAVVMVLTKIMESVVNFFIQKAFPPSAKLADEDKSRLEALDKKVEKLYDMHNIYDEDGKPLWYIPRSINLAQKEALGQLVELGHSQANIVRSLESIARILNELDKRSRACESKYEKAKS
jgi:Mg2+ and Co2+ transporter CorA